MDARGLVPTLAGVPGKPTFTTLSMVAENQDVLQSAAEDTGGRAFLNTNDIRGAIRRAADDARMTYVLGYYPTNEVWDGRFHRVEVKVNRPGVEVRHRKGYFAVATEKQASAQRSAALRAAVASPIGANGLGLRLRIDPVAGRPPEYRLAVRVEAGGIALEQRADELRGALDVIVAQIRADGSDVRSFDHRADISLSVGRLQQFQREGLRIEHTVTLTPGVERLRVVVRDVRTGAIGAIGVSRRQLEAIVPRDWRDERRPASVVHIVLRSLSSRWLEGGPDGSWVPALRDWHERLAGCGRRTSQTTVPAALSATLRDHVKNERFEVVTSIRGLPLGVRDGLQTLFGSQTLDIAESSAEIQAPTRLLLRSGRFAGWSRPGVRPITASSTTNAAGATTHGWWRSFIGRRPRPAASGAVIARAGLATIDEVRNAVLSGVAKGPVTTW